LWTFPKEGCCINIHVDGASASSNPGVISGGE